MSYVVLDPACGSGNFLVRRLPRAPPNRGGSCGGAMRDTEERRRAAQSTESLSVSILRSRTSGGSSSSRSRCSSRA